LRKSLSGGNIFLIGDPAQETPRAFVHGIVQQPAEWPLLDDNPTSTKTIRSATSRAYSTSWVTMIIVIPAFATPRTPHSTAPARSSLPSLLRPAKRVGR
jgi:hypothetical protein